MCYGALAVAPPEWQKCHLNASPDAPLHSSSNGTMIRRVFWKTIWWLDWTEIKEKRRWRGRVCALTQPIRCRWQKAFLASSCHLWIFRKLTEAMAYSAKWSIDCNLLHDILIKTKNINRDVYAFSMHYAPTCEVVTHVEYISNTFTRLPSPAATALFILQFCRHRFCPSLKSTFACVSACIRTLMHITHRT